MHGRRALSRRQIYFSREPQAVYPLQHLEWVSLPAFHAFHLHMLITDRNFQGVAGCIIGFDLTGRHAMGHQLDPG